MTDVRPNPDELLARVRDEEHRARRGRLRIFFGYAAGVGKTYAMLAAAQAERTKGVDLVVGYVEPHGRAETESLLQGLEQIPVLSATHRGAALSEFDLDSALARHPQIVLVDELAHTNAPGMRHPKRWQDVEELLAAGIDVWTTLNVQHIESLNDVIAQITGVAVKETLPDTVIERADEIELIDIQPAKLMERLASGKVYIPSQAERALKNFFQKSNLVALRELSLRQAANRLQRDVETARQERSAAAPWMTSERLLVCVGPSPTSARIIRATKRLATSLGAEWLAVSVDTGTESRQATAMESTSRNLHLAETLGAYTHSLVGDSVAASLLEFARSRNVTKIVAGKTAQPKWKQWFSKTVVDQLLEQSGDIDIYVVSGEGEPPRSTRFASGTKQPQWPDFAKALTAVGVCAVLGWAADAAQTAESNVVMIFLAGVAFVASRLGRWPSIVAAIASVLVFDLLFVPPRLTFAVSDTQYAITFAVMLGIGLLISELTSRLQSQLRTSQRQEQRTAQLFRMTKQLSELSGTEFLIRTAGRQLEEVFDGEIAIFLRDDCIDLSLRYGEQSAIASQPINEVVAQWVAANGKTAGAGTDTLPNATALIVPLAGSQQVMGALGVIPKDASRFANPEQVRLLETCGSLIALALERDRSMLQAHEAQLRVEAEQLRNSLLSSVSHDLRTPLAAISGTASAMLETAPEREKDNLQTIVHESERLTRLVENLLEMARLDSGTIALNRQWHVLEEIVGTALHSVKRQLANHSVRVEIAPDFPLIYVDGFLIEQALVNLLENAARYTPLGSEVEIAAIAQEKSVEIRVSDTGPGVPTGTEQRVFDKFFRGATIAPDGRRGVGLGLAICKAIADSHGGTISVTNRAAGGAVFTIVLPRRQAAPSIQPDADPAVAST